MITQRHIRAYNENPFKQSYTPEQIDGKIGKYVIMQVKRNPAFVGILSKFSGWEETLFRDGYELMGIGSTNFTSEDVQKLIKFMPEDVNYIRELTSREYREFERILKQAGQSPKN